MELLSPSLDSCIYGGVRIFLEKSFVYSLFNVSEYRDENNLHNKTTKMESMQHLIFKIVTSKALNPGMKG